MEKDVKMGKHFYFLMFQWYLYILSISQPQYWPVCLTKELVFLSYYAIIFAYQLEVFSSNLNYPYAGLI